MNPIKRKLVSVMTEALERKIAALEPSSELAQELSKIDLDKYMKQDIEKFCEAASMEEVMKIAFLGTKLRIATGQEEETIRVAQGSPRPQN